MTWQAFVLLALAAFRLTRLVTTDDVTAGARRALSGLSDFEHFAWERRLVDLDREVGVFNPWRLTADERRSLVRAEIDASPPPEARWRWQLGVLLRCPWCAGLWLSAALAAAYTAWADASWAVAPILALALSGVVGLTARQLDPKEA